MIIILFFNKTESVSNKWEFLTALPTLLKNSFIKRNWHIIHCTYSNCIIGVFTYRHPNQNAGHIRHLLWFLRPFPSLLHSQTPISFLSYRLVNIFWSFVEVELYNMYFSFIISLSASNSLLYLTLPSYSQGNGCWLVLSFSSVHQESASICPNASQLSKKYFSS